MKYKQQLYFILSFIGLRLLMLVLYTFFKPAQPGPYTPYILFLYSLFDVLILCYLYRFVKGIKQQPFSLIAVILIVAATAYNLLIDLFFPFDAVDWTELQLQLLTAPSNIINLLARIVLIVQLINNKASDHSKKFLRMLGWSYVATLLIGIGLSLVDSNSTVYATQLTAMLPWVAMLLLYINELKHYSEAGIK
ncbi:MAG: hypothetical protein JWM14_951 [Chitinophagaceae bacterium]|nr:hypothetical protein [Chitinophagaceae bacterium]